MKGKTLIFDYDGTIHAIGTANNLLAAMIDNHINHGNELGIDTRKITWRRCVDMPAHPYVELMIAFTELSRSQSSSTRAWFLASV